MDQKIHVVMLVTCWTVAVLHFTRPFLPFVHTQRLSSRHLTRPAPRDPWRLDLDLSVRYLPTAAINNNPTPPPHTKRDKPFRPRLLLARVASAVCSARERGQTSQSQSLLSPRVSPLLQNASSPPHRIPLVAQNTKFTRAHSTPVRFRFPHNNNVCR